MVDRLALVTYETPSAPCGGIAAVMKHLPPALQRAAGLPVVVIAPCHHRVPSMRAVIERSEFRGAVRVPFDGGEVLVHILRHVSDWTTYYLLPEDPQFFAGVRHPYDLGATGEEIGANLMRDSLLFGVAVARSLQLIGPGADWGLFLQDWEAATTMLALAESPGRHQVALTLHNSYDCDVSDETLWRFGISSDACPGTSVLHRVLPLVELPITTVSGQFALDLSEDVLQTDLIAPHLQEFFRRHPVEGVDNGPFVEQAAPQEFAELALLGRFEGLHKWKTMRRQAFRKSLEAVAATHKAGGVQPWGNRELPWGDVAEFLSQLDPTDSTPWFVMGGRDDSRQKGYDVAAAAARDFLSQGAPGRFLFFPIPGDEGAAGLSFLRELATSHPNRVMVFLGRFRDGYMAALQGASYGLMPSLYEPFGAANEFYLNGTVGIGRGTGGIVEQVVPLQTASSFTQAVELRAMRWHARHAAPTGFLFREPDGIPSVKEDWLGINIGAYNKTGGAPNRVAERRRFVLFDEMARGLERALRDAAAVFTSDRPLYYRMLAAGMNHIRDQFSWEKAAKQYLQCLEAKAAR